MKTFLLSIFSLLFICSFAQDAQKKNLAEATQYRGVYVFIYSKPVQPYDYLGSIVIKVAWSGQPNEMIEIAFKKLKKEYPTADGIIFTGSQLQNADAIKFKD